MSGSNSISRRPIRSRNANLRFFMRCNCNWSKVVFSTKASIAPSRSRCSCCNSLIRASISVFSKNQHPLVERFPHQSWLHGPSQNSDMDYTRSFERVHGPFCQLRRRNRLVRQNDPYGSGRFLHNTARFSCCETVLVVKYEILIYLGAKV